VERRLGRPGTLKLGGPLHAPVGGSHPPLRDLADATPSGELPSYREATQIAAFVVARQGMVWQPRGETGDRLHFCWREDTVDVGELVKCDGTSGLSLAKKSTNTPAKFSFFPTEV
jgi:hypothetical protein